MKKTVIAFEYNREEDSLHNNVFMNGEFDYPLCSYGFMPLAIIPLEMARTEEYYELCNWIHENKPDYEEAVIKTLETIKLIPVKEE